MPRRFLTVVAYGLLVAAGVVWGVLGAFSHLATLDVAGVRLPYMLPLLLGGLAALAFGGARACGCRSGALLPSAAWLAVTLLMADPRPEGDVIVTGEPASLAYLLLGTVVVGVAVGVGPPGRVGRVEE